MDVYGNLDLLTNVISDFGFDTGAALPDSPPLGTPFYLDSNNSKEGLYVYTQTGWHNVNEVCEGAGIPVNSPDYIGQIYVDTLVKTLYVATGLGRTDWLLVVVQPATGQSNNFPSYSDGQKLVSISSSVYPFSLKGRVRNLYLDNAGGIDSNILGSAVIGPGFIVKAVVQVSTYRSPITFDLYDQGVKKSSLTLTGEANSFDLSLPVTSSSLLSVYSSSWLDYDNPSCALTLRWT